MTRLYDDEKIMECSMCVTSEANGVFTQSENFAEEFFDVGALHYNEELNAYKVRDVEYCAEQMDDWRDAVGDYEITEAQREYNDENGIERHVFYMFFDRPDR